MTRGNKHKCYYCGQEEECTSDHFYPKSKGGRVKVYACGLCQRTKASMFPIEFITYIKNHVAIDVEIKLRIERAIVSLIKLTIKMITKDQIIATIGKVVKNEADKSSIDVHTQEEFVKLLGSDFIDDCSDEMSDRALFTLSFSDESKFGFIYKTMTLEEFENYLKNLCHEWRIETTS